MTATTGTYLTALTGTHFTATGGILLSATSGILWPLLSNKDIPVEDLLNWDDLYAVIDNIYGGYYSKIYKKYADLLSNKEYQLCCLLKAEFSTKEISVVTQQSIRTIYQRKSTIRQKLAMNEKEDIVEYLDSIV